MILTKEQQAQKYAEKIAGNTCMAPVIAETWLAGYTACEQSMWRSVEEELPSNDADVLTSDENGLHIASYFNGEWYSCDDEFTRNPQMWMPIPPITDTKTEKK